MPVLVMTSSVFRSTTGVPHSLDDNHLISNRYLGPCPVIFRIGCACAFIGAQDTVSPELRAVRRSSQAGLKKTWCAAMPGILEPVLELVHRAVAPSLCALCARRHVRGEGNLLPRGHLQKPELGGRNQRSAQSPACIRPGIDGNPATCRKRLVINGMPMHNPDPV